MPAENLLKTVPLFTGLEKSDLAKIAGITSPKTFAEDSVIFNIEDPGEIFFVIKTGKVKIAVPSESGREITLATLREGDFFGEMALIDGEPRSAMAIATESTEVLQIHRRDFVDILTRHPSMMLSLMITLSRRLRRADQKIEDLAFLPVPSRLAKVLLSIAQESGEKVREGWVINLHLTHQELADIVGTSRETVTRILSSFTRQHLIARTRQGMVISDPVRLGAQVQGG